MELSDETIKKITESEVVYNSREYGVACHNNVNQLYGGKPYSIHLDIVAAYVMKYIYLISDVCDVEYFIYLVSAAYTHDTIEDCRETFNNVLKATNKEIAELTYAVTDEKGKTRDERKNDKFYTELLEVPFADYLKICDRLANAYYSSINGSRMESVYNKEYEHFKEKLYKEMYDDMFVELEKIMNKQYVTL
jgi:(p)ppGpp synthase/HD superfamily hydrolase